MVLTGTEAELSQLSLVSLDSLQGTLSYQWKRDGNSISGATSANYTLVQADVGKVITVTVSTDVTGVADITSDATGNIADVNNSPEGSVTINGTTETTNELTVSQNLTDIDGMTNVTISYQWKRAGSNIATGTSYRLVSADEGQEITVVASYEDEGGFSNTSTSASVTPSAPTVSVTGTATQGETLGIDTGNLQGTLSYQWETRGASDIAGANAANYTLVQADVGSTIKVVVTSDYNSYSVESGSTGTVANVNDPVTGTVTVDGTPKVSNELTAVTANLSDPDGLGTFSYQWKRGTSDIAGATSDKYTLVDDDDGNNISVVVSYTDALGAAESKESASVSVSKPTLVLTGTEAELSQLSLVSLDSLQGTLSYQWTRDGNSISDANTANYTLVQADVGKVIR